MDGRMMDGERLEFRVEGIPPRRTLQSGRGAYRGEDGQVHFFTKSAVRAEAWQMLAEFRRQLPQGWRARGGACRVRVCLVYPVRKRDKVFGEDLIPHTERPDADNLVKSLLDSMTRAGVWIDDAQVYRLSVEKYRGRRPRWAVCVTFEEEEKPMADGQGRLF